MLSGATSAADDAGSSMRKTGAIRPDGAAVPSPTCSATIEPAVIAWRHGLALALAVTDADVDCDAVLDGTSDAERAAEPEREPDAHAEMVFWIVTVGDVEVLAVAREDRDGEPVLERDAVIDAVDEAQGEADRE